MAEQKKDYTSQNLSVLKFPDCVIKRPTMYLGRLEEEGVIHLLREIVDNSIDEFLAKFATTITIDISTKKDDVYFSVADNGRGIPSDNPAKFKSLFCELHSGGKFDNDSYSNSSGLNGVGLSITNAMSDILNVKVKRAGKQYEAQYESGYETIPLRVINNTTKGTGTEILFKPNLERFMLENMDNLSNEVISSYLQEMAFLNEGIKIDYTFNGKKTVYQYNDGLKAFIEHIANKQPLLIKDFKFSGKDSSGGKDDKSVRIELNWLEASSKEEMIKPYCNSIHNTEGGVHVAGLRMGLTTAIKKYISENNLITKKDSVELEEITGDDIRESLIAIIDLKHKSPLFSSQIKANLTNKDVNKFVSGVVSEGITQEFNINPALAKNLCRRFIENSKVRKAVKLSKEKIVKKSSGSLSATKLADCTSKERENCELFIIEGDSAKGTANQARDIRIQALYPLKGKIMNTHGLHLNKVLANKELGDLINVLGVGIGDSKDITSLRYGKIIFMCDADVDGFHIQCLLMTFFLKYYPELINAGHVYLAVPPLFVLRKGNSRYYCCTEKEKIAKEKELKAGFTVTRFKGLGEMNADQLEETAMNVETRSLIRLTIADMNETVLAFESLMGANPDKRKDFILENSDLATVDN